jgi:hypothetical protein
MEPAPFVGMAEDDYKEPNLDAEDPELTPQNHWRMMLPVLLFVALPIAGVYVLTETTGTPPWPSHNAWLHGNVPERGEAVGTSGQAETATVPEDDSASSALPAVTSIAGDPRKAVGRRVNFEVPVSGSANDEAFWIGSEGQRVLVVFGRDHRNGEQRQESRVVDSGIAPLEAGRIAAISGSIQELPKEEEMYSWGLTRRDRRELASTGVYLRADRVSVR